MNMSNNLARASAQRHASHFAGASDNDTSLVPAQDKALEEVSYRRPKTVRILVADDDDVDRERVHRMLARSRLACEIINAGSGQQALELLQREAPDCILLDHHLGDMTGTDVLNKINRGGVMTPVIMITGHGDEQLAVHAMRLGIYDYLPKRKLNAEKLANAIDATLRNAALQQHLIEMQKRLERMSLFDELTGLANRNLFFDRINQAVLNAAREDARFTVLMMDLNLFKEVNDNLGHEAGDSVLAEIGRRLRAISRKSDTVARLGGDEFTCIPHGIDTTAGAISYAEKIVAAVSEPLIAGKHVVEVGISIGIALYPQHGTDVSTLLANADDAMYRAKQSLGSYVVHSEADQPRDAPAAAGDYLHKAVEAQELYLVYQPKINLTTNKLVGVEALARWHNPELGAVYPAQFIPLAERSALIAEITFATIGMALDQLALWHQQDQLRVPVSINLSARMLDHAGLADRIMRELNRRHLQPRDLLIEITETALSSSNEVARQVLTELAATGIGISIDDFGSGFTSLKYLRDIDFSEIKIDRMFIKDIAERERDVSIVRSIILLSDTLEVTVVAEGVESEENRYLLGKLGCHCAQGYSIGQPMLADDLLQWSRRPS